MKKILGGLTLLTILVLLYYVINSFFGKTDYIKNQNIPESYKNYPFLDNLTSNSKYKVIAFKSTHQEFTDKINDSVICISVRKNDEKNSDIIKKYWYKINQLGIVTDSLNIIDKVSNEEIYQKRRYLINKKKDYYLTWMLDGDTLKKPFTLIEKGKYLEKDAYLHYTKESKFSTYGYTYDSITSERIRKTFYFKNDRWNIIYSKKRYKINEPCCEYTTVDFKDVDEIAILDFFEKTEQYKQPYIKGFGINGHTPEHWKGIGYYNIPINNNRKIEFKIPNLKLYESNHIDFDSELKIYNNPQNNYTLIINNSLRNKGSLQYLIQYK